jgi:tetratricopeptide (TPR) repeat protein
MIRTKSAIRRAAFLVAAVLSLNSISQGTTGDVALDRYLAERFALKADQISTMPDSPSPVLRQSAALLDLARELNPNEIRFARQAADLFLRMGERDRAIDALSAVRRIDPADQLAMIQYIDLVSSKLETAEQKIGYLMQVADARGVSPEVQSHAAYKLVNLYYARAQDGEAEEALKKALQLNNQNMAALKLKYQIAAQRSDTKTRVQALAELMRSAPTDTDGMLALAHEADAVGSYETSAMLRLYALQVNASRGSSLQLEEAINFIGTQMLAGKDETVKGLLTQLMGPMKEDGRVYTLSLLYLQWMGEEAAADAVPMARGVYLAQLAGVSQLLNEPEKKEMPTTNPAVPMPNVRADVAKLKAADPNQLGTAYAVALSEQIWFDLFFKAAEVDDTVIEALGQLIGADDPIVVRFQGWKLLAAGKIDEARVKFEAVSDRDGFARLGKIIADAASNQPDKARDEIGQLLRERPTGMIAAYIALLAKKMHAEVDQTPQEMDVADIIAGVQRHIAEVMNNPRQFYLLTANPDKVSYMFGEPMIAVVTLINNGRVPITIGAGGLVEPTFQIDAQVHTVDQQAGALPQVFSAVARGKFTGVVKLKPGQKITQTLRIDRDRLFDFLQTYATPLFPISGWVTSNPVPDGEHGWRSGAGGQQTKLGKAFERQSAPFYVEAYRSKVLEKLAAGSSVERAAFTEMLGPVINAVKQQVDNPDAAAVAKTLGDALKTSLQNETNPELRTLMLLGYQDQLTDEQWISELVGSKTVIGQVGAMLVVRGRDKAQRESVARAVLTTQPAPAVAEFANALLAQPDLPKPEPSDQEQPAETP